MRRSLEFASASRCRQKGYTLLATGIAIFAIMGMTGLAVDLGRMYIVKNEAQTFVDIAAIDAALELDGTVTGFDDARNAVNTSVNAWNFGHSRFAGNVVEFSQFAAGPWETNPGTGADYRFVKVTASSDVPITFMQSLVSGETRPVSAEAIAGQLPVTSLKEGACPFAPLAHDPLDPVHFGLTPGEEYTLHWPATPSLDKNLKKMPCAGDETAEMIEMSQKGGSQYRGFIEDPAASVLTDIILYDRQTATRFVGELIPGTEGGTVSVRQAVQDRVADDTDHDAASYADYKYQNAGNGRRIMSCPVTAWSDTAGTYEVIGFRKFFLLRANEYLPNKTESWCGIYTGESYVTGSIDEGAGSPGHYVVRLVQ